MVFLTAVLVAHVSVLDGKGFIERTSGKSALALRNAPILAGDTIALQPRSRAEVQFDPNVALRLDGSSRAEVVALAYGHREVRLLDGSIAVSMLREDDAPQVDTPEVTMHPVTPGLYRVAVEAERTTIDVRRGSLLLFTPNGTQHVTPGERVTVSGSRAQPVLRYGSPPPLDDFDAYDAARDSAMQAAQREPHLPAALAGYVSLRAYGTWVRLKTYGEAWQPHIYPGWAPYRLGRWFWRRDAGWVWISRESWGWLPYHYGAWTFDPARGWCWVPPRAQSPAWYASTAIFFQRIVRGRAAGIGWLPLAPLEPFRSSLAAYRNARVRGGITLVTIGDFYSGNFSRLSTPPAGTVPVDARLAAPPPPGRYQSEPSPRRM